MMEIRRGKQKSEILGVSYVVLLDLSNGDGGLDLSLGG